MATTKTAAVKFEVQNTATAKQDINGIRDAFTNLSDTEKQSASAITNAFQNIENASDKVTKKISDGKAVTVKDGAAVLQQWELLKAQIDSAFGSISNAPAAIQAAYAKAEVQFKSTTKTVATLTDSVADQKAQLKEGGVQWDGFSNKINQALGPMGGMQVQALAIGGAFTAGIQLGTKFAEAIGTNFDAAKTAAEGLKASVAGVTNALVTDGPAAALTHLVAAVTNLDDTVTGSGTTMKGYNAIVDAGVDRQKALNVSTDDLRIAFDAYTLAQQGGANGLKLYRDLVNTTDPSQLGEALTAAKGKFEDLAKAEKLAKEEVEHLKTAQDNIVKAFDSEIQKLEELKLAKKLHVDSVNAEIKAEEAHIKAATDAKDAAEAQANASKALPAAFNDELKKLDELTHAYGISSGEVKAFVGELQADYDAYKTKIDPARQKQIEQIVELGNKYGDLDPAQKADLQVKIAALLATQNLNNATGDHVIHLDKAMHAINNVSGAYEAHNVLLDKAMHTIGNVDESLDANSVHFDKNKKTISNLDEAVDKIGKKGGTYTEFGNSADEAAKRVAEYDKAIDASIGKLQIYTQKLKDAAAAMKDLGAVTNDTAGGGSSSSHDSGDMPGGESAPPSHPKTGGGGSPPSSGGGFVTPFDGGFT